MLHFAYGSNMCCAVMRKHASRAQPLGAASLSGYRFIISADGYASIAPARGVVMHGVLWRLTARDRSTLDAWEDTAGGRYRADILPVRHQDRGRMALVYRARPGERGCAKSGYMELVIAAAREWQLPSDYISALHRFMRPSRRGRSLRPHGEFRWT
jgi:hypothetical protein